MGQKFLKYTIQEQIGRGGHAWVYHGHDPFLDNEVAIKILHRHGGVTEDMLRRGQVEAKLLFRLKHPNIVEVQDAGISEDGLLYIVMELLRGKSLRDLLRERRRFPLKEALLLFLEMTNGVEAAHAFGAIHRDLKPENVFILADGSCKILDFGIAKVVDAAGITTERDVLHGTILYISPEQLEGNRATPRSDLYALGLVFFEALHGRHPLLLKSTDPTVRELSLRQIGYRPPPLDELDETIPRHVARVVERLLMKSPRQRLQSTQELRAALADSLRRLAEDDSLPPPAIRQTSTDRIPLARDTERMPLPQRPDHADSSPPEESTPTNQYSACGLDLGSSPVAGSSDATPTARTRSHVGRAVPSSTRRATAPPLVSPIRTAPGAVGRRDREAARQIAARALVAGAAVGVALGAMYLWFHAHALRPTTPSERATVLQDHPAQAALAAAPTELSQTTTEPSVSSAASRSALGTSSAPLATASGVPSVSRALATSTRRRAEPASAERPAPAGHPSALLRQSGAGPRGEPNGGEARRDGAAADHPKSWADSKPWIE